MRDLPHQVYINKQQHREAREWCQQQWGQGWSVLDNRRGTWCCFWAGTRGPYRGMYEYSFHNEQDALMFALRWS